MLPNGPAFSAKGLKKFDKSATLSEGVDTEIKTDSVSVLLRSNSTGKQPIG